MTEPKRTDPAQLDQPPKTPPAPANPYANGRNPFLDQQHATNPQDTQADPTAPSAPSDDLQQPATPQRDMSQPDVRLPQQQPQQPQNQTNEPIQPPAIVEASGLSKVVWFLGGFLLGLIGVFILYIMNLGRPRPVRGLVIRYALIGMVAGALFSMIVLGLGGFSTGTGLIGPMAGGTGTSTSTGSGIF